MTLSLTEFLATGSVLFAIFMTGTLQLRKNILLYSFQTYMIGFTTISYWMVSQDTNFILFALAIILAKAIGVSCFLFWILKLVNVRHDGSTLLPAPITMHTSILLMGLSHFLALNLPKGSSEFALAGTTAAGISLLLIGLLFMLTRKTAMSQIIGFLTLENGIYLFTLSLAHGMPLVVELGIMLDVLVGVMIAGVITFRIQKSFEHIDTTQLKDLID